MKEKQLDELRIKNALASMRKLYADHAAKIKMTTPEEYKLLKDSIERDKKVKERNDKIDNLLND